MVVFIEPNSFGDLILGQRLTSQNDAVVLEELDHAGLAEAVAIGERGRLGPALIVSDELIDGCLSKPPDDVSYLGVRRLRSHLSTARSQFKKMLQFFEGFLGVAGF